MLNQEQFILRASAAQTALIDVGRRERLLAQEKAMLWLDIAASAFSLLPDEFSGWAKLSWREGHEPSCAAMALCPAGSVFAYEAAIAWDSFSGELLMSRVVGGRIMGEMISVEDRLPEDLLPSAHLFLEGLQDVLDKAEVGLMGFLRSSIPILLSSDGQRSWSAQARGKELLAAESFANAIGMQEAAALWESLQIGKAGRPANTALPRQVAL